VFTFIATHGKKHHIGGILECVAWAQAHATTDVPAHILRARPGENDTRLVAEATPERVSQIRSGRVTRVRTAWKVAVPRG